MKFKGVHDRWLLVKHPVGEPRGFYRIPASTDTHLLFNVANAFYDEIDAADQSFDDRNRVLITPPAHHRPDYMHVCTYVRGRYLHKQNEVFSFHIPRSCILDAKEKHFSFIWVLTKNASLTSNGYVMWAFCLVDFLYLTLLHGWINGRLLKGFFFYFFLVCC